MVAKKDFTLRTKSKSKNFAYVAVRDASTRTTYVVLPFQQHVGHVEEIGEQLCQRCDAYGAPSDQVDVYRHLVQFPVALEDINGVLAHALVPTSGQNPSPLTRSTAWGFAPRKAEFLFPATPMHEYISEVRRAQLLVQATWFAVNRTLATADTRVEWCVLDALVVELQDTRQSCAFVIPTVARSSDASAGDVRLQNIGADLHIAADLLLRQPCAGTRTVLLGLQDLGTSMTSKFGRFRVTNPATVIEALRQARVYLEAAEAAVASPSRM